MAHTARLIRTAYAASAVVMALESWVTTPGTYNFQAVAIYSIGEVETSDSAEVFVLSPDVADHHANH